MTYYSYNKIKLSKIDKSLRIYILQIIVLYNVILMGLDVKKIGTHKYLLSSKHITINDIDLTEFLQQIVQKSQLF